eukprot:Tbor_TRINITY_DN5890_c0_g1::TRINITY_DN5890_c0_g1_i21::g.6335::m.6335
MNNGCTNIITDSTETETVCSRPLFAADSKDITWNNAPPQLLSAHLDAKDVLEVLHYAEIKHLDQNLITVTNGCHSFTTCTYDITFKAVYLNNTEVTDRKLEYLVVDGEATDNEESIAVTTNGTNFTMAEVFGEGNVKSEGNGTTTVTFDTQESQTFPVFSSKGNVVQ